MKRGEKAYRNEGGVAIQLTPQVKQTNVRHVDLPLHLRELRISHLRLPHVLDGAQHLVVDLLLRDRAQVVLEVVRVEVQVILRAVLLWHHVRVLLRVSLVEYVYDLALLVQERLRSQIPLSANGAHSEAELVVLRLVGYV